jgi:hypothetical protein
MRSANKAAAISGLVLAVLALGSFAAWGSQCRPKRPRPTVVLTSMGPCRFELERLSFAGDPVQQAQCLLRPVGIKAELGPELESLPPVLADRVGRSSGFPDRQLVGAALIELGLEDRFGDALIHPVSRAQDNDPFAPAARYFVIHDTSGPNVRRFPADLNDYRLFNSLAGFVCDDGWGIAHAVINRHGRIFLSHDFEVPWRATKFERATQFGTALKGLFLHVEMTQPRRGRGGVIAPTPGFSPAQYDRLALLYVIASVRAGTWLIPAFHAPIDKDIRNGHDDPQNFELASFAASLQGMLDRMQKLEVQFRRLPAATGVETVAAGGPMPRGEMSAAGSPTPRSPARNWLFSLFKAFVP